MGWAPWPKADEKGIARYVLPSTADELRLGVNRDDLLAQGRTREVIEAIYDALRAPDIRYAREPYDPEKRQQIIRAPAALLHGGGEGTCLDLALLFAGICLGRDLLPLVVVLKGHALVAVSLTMARAAAAALPRAVTDGDWVKGGLLTDAAVLRQLVDSDAYLLVECTGLAHTENLPATHPEGRDRHQGRLPFDRAVAAGREQLDHPGRPLVFAVDVAVQQDVNKIPPYDPAASLERMSPLLRMRLSGVLDAHDVFGGRDAELARLDRIVADRPGYVFVTGPSGSGKTALLANWVRRLEARGEAVAYHFISGYHATASHDDTFRTLGEQLVFWYRSGEAVPANAGELEGLFYRLITVRSSLDRLVVVIDGLDEADGWAPVARLFPKTLAPGVSVVLSARETGVDWVRTLGLSVRELIRLDPLDEARIADLLRAAGGAAAAHAADPAFIRALHERSKGDAFYVRFLVHDLLDGQIASVADLKRQPERVDDYLQQWWDELSQRLDGEAVRDLLGYLVVSRGALTRGELAAVSPEDKLDSYSIDGVVKTVRRFVVGSADGGFALCHPRLHEYIAEKKIVPDDQRKYRDRLVAWCANWAVNRSRYAVSYYVGHLSARIRSDDEGARAESADRLVRLIADDEFQRASNAVRADVPALVRDVESALPPIVAGPGPLTTVVAAAVNMEGFRARWVRPDSVFDGAVEGRLREAEQRLELFALEEQWRQVAQLVVAWLAPPAAKTEAERVFNTVSGSLQRYGPLPLLAARVAASIHGTEEPELVLPYHPGRLPAPPSLGLVEQIVARIGGSQDPHLNISGLESFRDKAQYGDETPVYVAEGDTPLLVAFAQAHPLGDAFLRQYIAIHAANPYAQYRNRSLWGVLGAVLCHETASRARDYARLVTSAAIATTPVRYREGLRLTVTALLAGRGHADAIETLETRFNDARWAAGTLGRNRWTGDSWGHHRRRFALFAELYALVFDERGRAAALLDEALRMPFGFAGYNAPANLALTESNAVCRPGERGAIDRALEAARRAAHNVQEVGFCARTTAHVNAMRERWWKPPIGDLAGTIARFSDDPFDPEFAPLHFVAEPYDARSDGKETLPLSNEVRDAATLRQLAENVYHVPAAELQLMNPGVDADRGLRDGHPVALADRRFAPLLAARLAAEVLTSPLGATERVALIRRLVPVASPNQTALDTVLSRMLLAAAPSDDVLVALRDLAPDVWMDEPQPAPFEA